jgi:hypothetical protein
MDYKENIGGILLIYKPLTIIWEIRAMAFKRPDAPFGDENRSATAESITAADP